MKTTPFTHFHEQLGAKMAEFAGYNMPIVYSSINEEHIAVRNSIGVFDVSHMGEIWIKGPKAFELVQKITSNDVAKLVPEAAQYSCFPNGKGGIVDDLIVYYYENDKYLLVVNASNTEKDWNWIVEQNKSVGAEIENASDNIAQLAIQGPKAVEMMQKLTDVDLSAIKFYHFTVGTFAGVDNVIISATGYTGSGGFELYMYNNDAEKIWNAVFEAGKKYDIKPIGLAARDTLRLEMGYCLYGNDINDTTSPLEAGLGWITKFVDGNDFIDRDYMAKLKEDGLKKRLIGFEMVDKGIPRHDYDIVDADGNKIGIVTSGTMSPMLKIGIGMGYVPFELRKAESEIFIQVRKKRLKAKVVKFPFWKG
ncbi:MAG: glycine cleavage system aminomethyltransferase GcvT [Bacteroidota bacterium]|nr:glycine cleavage system aminomethyltransferase GcvT [Bacteroidota bacterium]